MAQSHNDAVCCQGYRLEGPKLQIIEHYLWEELSAWDVPFECLDCNARFHHRRYAVWHMKMEHGYQKPIRDAFMGSLRDLPVYSMVGNNLNPRRRQPQHGGQQPWRQCHEPWHTRERHQDTAKDKATPATASTVQSVLPTPDQ